MEIGDKATMAQDFNNEPGTIPAGTKGVIFNIVDSPCAPWGLLYFVEWELTADMDVHYSTLDANHEFGLPMHLDELAAA
jgi:hypothetical protein